MNLGIKYFFNNPIFISLAANKVLIGAKINTHKLIKTASKPPDMTSIETRLFKISNKIL